MKLCRLVAYRGTKKSLRAAWHGALRTVHGCDVAEHAVRRYGGCDGIGQADLSLGQLVLVREEDSDRV
jgi:hypothetical protein